METERKKTDFWYIFISLCLCLFCVLKVLRGADTENTQAGGVWNYISLVYYPLLFLWLIKGEKFNLKTVFIAPTLYMIFGFVFTFLTTPISLSVSSVYKILMIPYFYLIFVCFYIYTEDSKKGNNILVIAYVLCLVLNFMNAFKYLFMGADRAMASDVYFSLSLFPFALILVKKKGLKALLMGLQFFTVFLANKRTGILSYALGLIIYGFAGEASKDKKNMLKFLKTILILVVCIVAFFYISQYIDAKFDLGIYDRLYGIQEDKGSGRGTVYKEIWQAFLKSSFFEMMAGHGFNTAGPLVGLGHAHNDFLEILYNFGIIPLLCIIIYYFSLVKEAIVMVKNKSPYAPAFLYSIVIGVFLSMFSYFIIFYTYVTGVVAFWGFVLKKEKMRLVSESESIEGEDI